MKLSLKKIRSRLGGQSKGVWAREKTKAAGFLKLFGEMPIGRQPIHFYMQRQWYRHIDKALEGKSTSRDEKHWKKMHRTFKKEMVGIPTEETMSFLSWLKDFQHRVKHEEITEEDRVVWLPKFKEYIESCEKNAIDNFILKEKLVEVD